jgi:spore germination protein GerM
MNGRAVMIGAGVATIVLVGGMLVFCGRQRNGGGTPQAGSPSAGPAATTLAERKITATLFFITEDGMALQPVQQEVLFGDPIAEQARRILEAQLAAAPPPLASAIPDGTKLRALFVSERGDAFVDLTPEVTARHTGGALDELFTVYAIVNALTVNLPAITRVQILIDGKEADTLAGHVDLRHPLTKSLKWIRTDNPS